MNETEFISNLAKKYADDLKIYRENKAVSHLAGYTDHGLSCEAWEGELIYLMTRYINPKNAVEIGVANGFSAAQMGIAMTNGKLYLCEIESSYKDTIDNRLNLAGVHDFTTLIIHDIGDYEYMDTVIPKSDIGMVFIDRNSSGDDAYKDLVWLEKRITRDRFIIAMHDLWSAKNGSTHSIIKGVERFVAERGDLCYVLFSGKFPNELVSAYYYSTPGHSINGDESIGAIMPKKLYDEICGVL